MNKNNQPNPHQKAKTQMESNAQTDFQRVTTQYMHSQTVNYSEINTEQGDIANFSNVRTNQQKNLQLSLILHQKVQNQISSQIAKGKVLIQKPKQINLSQQKVNKQEQLKSERFIIKKMLQTQKKKIQTIKQLKRIQQDEIQLKRKSISFRLQKAQDKQKKTLKKQRSFYSPQQKQTVKKMLKRNQQLQGHLYEKTLKALRNYQTQCQMQQKRYEQQIQKQKSFHRSFVQQNKKKVQQKKLQRLELIQKGKKNFQQLKNRKYLYQDKQQIQYKQDLQQQIQYNKKIQTIKLKMKITTRQDIKEFREKYKDIIKSKISERNSINSMRGEETDSHQMNVVKKKFQENYFTKLIKNQISQRKMQQLEQKSKPFKLKSKAKQYISQYDLQIKPKIKSNQQSRFVPIAKNLSVHSLGYQQQRNQGNQYLSIAKKLKKCQTSQQQKILSTKINDNFTKQLSKRSYKNYLKQLKQQRRHSQNNPQTSKKFYNFLQKQGAITQFNSLNKAVFVAQSMQAISKKSKDQKLVDSVQNKINILKMII